MRKPPFFCDLCLLRAPLDVQQRLPWPASGPKAPGERRSLGSEPSLLFSACSSVSPCLRGESNVGTPPNPRLGLAGKPITPSAETFSLSPQPLTAFNFRL